MDSSLTPFSTGKNEENGATIVKTDDELASEMDDSIKKTLKLRDLDIYYDEASDTLSLWNGSPAGYGEMVAKHLTTESNAEGEVVGVTLEHAAELLKPYLFPESKSHTRKSEANHPINW